jgi:hypothetical protein
VQGVRRLGEVQVYEPKRKAEGLLLQVCAESNGFNTSKLLKYLSQGVCAGCSEMFRVGKISRRIRPSRLLKGSVGELRLEVRREVS